MVIYAMELNSQNKKTTKTKFHEVIDSQHIAGKLLSIERIGNDYSIYEVDSSGFERSIFSSQTLSDVITKYEQVITERKNGKQI